MRKYALYRCLWSIMPCGDGGRWVPLRVPSRAGWRLLPVRDAAAGAIVDKAFMRALKKKGFVACTSVPDFPEIVGAVVAL